MLACDTQEAWTQFIEFVKQSCSKSAFVNWLSPIRVVEALEEEITLEVPNIFVQEYLLSNYRKELASFLPTRGNGEPAINFVISAPKVEQPKSPPPSPPKIVSKAAPSNFYEVPLNNRYTFSTFIEGASNQFIKSAAMGVSSRPGMSYNPLFIHGPVGLGKTHILHAIGQHILDHHPKLKVQLITTEGFINDLVDNLRKKTIDRMKRFYRSDVGVLLIDDIQFLQNRLNFEEEFCILLDIYANNGKQVVLTSDKPPSQLKLSERMKARLEWGLVAHMGVPELETRVAILQHKAEKKGLDLPNDLAFYIAEHIFSNVRQLEGAVNRLNAHCRLLNTQISKDLVENVLGDMFQHAPTQKVSVDDILSSVATIFQVKGSDLKGSDRSKSIAIPRQVAMFLAKEFVNDSLVSLGYYFNKAHSTILHACKAIEQKMKVDEKLRRQVDMVRKDLEK